MSVQLTRVLYGETLYSLTQTSSGKHMMSSVRLPLLVQTPESLYGGVMKGFRRSRERSERTVMAETTKIREEVEKMQRGPLEARSFTLR